MPLSPSAPSSSASGLLSSNGPPGALPSGLTSSPRPSPSSSHRARPAPTRFVVGWPRVVPRHGIHRLRSFTYPTPRRCLPYLFSQAVGPRRGPLLPSSRPASLSSRVSFCARSSTSSFKTRWILAPVPRDVKSGFWGLRPFPFSSPPRSSVLSSSPRPPPPDCDASTFWLEAPRSQHDKLLHL